MPNKIEIIEGFVGAVSYTHLEMMDIYQLFLSMNLEIKSIGMILVT